MLLPMTTLRDFIANALKGAAMGIANVIPGVSGGTVAVITGIFERIVNAIKSFDVIAIRLLLSGRWQGLAERIDLGFLVPLGTGMLISIVSVAHLFKHLFSRHPVLIWSFFFGLILASVYFVAKTISRFTFAVPLFFAVGAAVAVGISVLTPGAENADTWYVVLCGVVAICSMILPGISGSFVLILMGNYELVVIRGISEMNLPVLIPFGAGCAAGIIAFSHLISWLMRRSRDAVIAVLTGFIAGSLLLIWPWKTSIPKLDAAGAILVRHGKEVVAGYRWHMPELNSETVVAVGLILAGGACVWAMESISSKLKS